MNNGSPAMMVEAKSLGTNLGGAVLSQGIQYCLEQGTRFFCVTDGSQWEIYETYRPVPIDDKRIVRFDLKDNPAQACLKALALWRPSVESGAIAAAQTPVVEPDQSQQSTPQIETESIPTPNVQPDVVIPLPENGEEQSLSEFIREDISVRPTQMIFPE